MQTAYYPGINVLRGFAALLVVVQHAGYFATRTIGVDSSVVVKVAFGHIGVVTFFTISGFVIGLNRHLPTTEFVARRALRIYPAFWAALVISAGLMALVDVASEFRWYAILLLPSRAYPGVHVPIWTLVFEAFFYAVAAFAFSRRCADETLSALALTWILAVFLMQPYMTGTLPIELCAEVGDGMKG